MTTGSAPLVTSTLGAPASDPPVGKCKPPQMHVHPRATGAAQRPGYLLQATALREPPTRWRSSPSPGVLL